MTEDNSPQNPWRDRLSALRNVPPVLRILWASSSRAVSWGVLLRLIVACLPFGIAKVAQYIINGIAAVLRHEALPAHFWHWVIAEVVLNIMLGLMMRAVDYTDSLLANSYT